MDLWINDLVNKQKCLNKNVFSIEFCNKNIKKKINLNTISDVCVLTPGYKIDNDSVHCYT